MTCYQVHCGSLLVPVFNEGGDDVFLVVPLLWPPIVILVCRCLLVCHLSAFIKLISVSIRFLMKD